MLFDRSDLMMAMRMIEQGAASKLSDTGFIAREIERWLHSPQRMMMLTGERYHHGDQEIKEKRRTGIGENGVVEEIPNIPNNRILDNQYRKMVNQKKNYLLGKPFTVQTDNEQYGALLNQFFDSGFMRMLKSIGTDSLNGGIAWLYVYYDGQGALRFKRFAPYTFLPFWSDLEHTRLDCGVRIYDVYSYEGTIEKVLHKVEVYGLDGIDYYEYQSGGLTPCDPWHQPYFTATGFDGVQELNWSKIPVIPFKYNEKEIPLIQMVKSLQDGLNEIESNFKDNMDEDERNTIMVLVNYGREDLGNFRHNLQMYGAVKVESVEGVQGDVKTLQVEVNSENYKSIIQIFKKAIIENAMGYDAKDDRLGGNANQMNIQSIYNDIDLDANDMETEYRAAFDQLMWFIDCHLANTGQGDFSQEEAEIRFNRDMLMNTGEAIDNCTKSQGLVSTKTILAHHPFVEDVDAELEALKKEKEENIETFGFGMTDPDGGTSGEKQDNTGDDDGEGESE